MRQEKNSRRAEGAPCHSESVDLERFHPARYHADAIPAPLDAGPRFNLLYCGPLTREHGIELLTDAFLAARERDARLHLVIVGRGPAEFLLRDRIGADATFLGWLDRDRRAPIYASADLLVLPSGRSSLAVLEAQASGLPVLAVDQRPASELIQPGRSGCLVAAETEALAAALRGLARRPALCERLATGGLVARAA